VTVNVAPGWVNPPWQATASKGSSGLGGGKAGSGVIAQVTAYDGVWNVLALATGESKTVESARPARTLMNMIEA
jgi:hypothetical protein